MTSDDQTIPVIYGEPGAAAAVFQHARPILLSVDEVVARLRKAIEAADLWVLAEIDPQMLLRRGGYAIGAGRQILFFHPRLMARLLAADPAALLEAPLKFAVLELPGRGIEVRWIDPAASFSRYGSPALSELGRELAAVCASIVATGL